MSFLLKDYHTVLHISSWHYRIYCKDTIPGWQIQLLKFLISNYITGPEKKNWLKKKNHCGLYFSPSILPDFHSPQETVSAWEVIWQEIDTTDTRISLKHTIQIKTGAFIRVSHSIKNNLKSNFWYKYNIYWNSFLLNYNWEFKLRSIKYIYCPGINDLK